MSDTPGATQNSKTDERKEKYYSFQIKGWTSFDPMGQTLAKIAENIEQGEGFLTLVETVKTESSLASIGDEDVKECFTNIIAAKRLVKTAHELPKNLRDQLRAALKNEDTEASPKKPGASVANLGASGEAARTKLWP